MKNYTQWVKNLLAMVAGLHIVSSALADTIITSFDDFFHLDGLFAWSDATVLSSETNYSITDIGYGSGYKTISPNIDATAETHIQLTVTISAATGPTASASGPIVGTDKPSALMY